MKTRKNVSTVVGMAAGLISGLLLVPGMAWAHCDTLDGPVVVTAKAALAKGDITPVLKWVQKDQEGEIREAFQKTLAVRIKGPEAKDLADMYFFETLVRIHRAGEGAPYTGLKPAGTETSPVVQGADKALETGSADRLVKMVTDAIAAGIRERFAKAAEAKKQADGSVGAGREFVEAYVEFVHYVEGIYDIAQGHAGPHGQAAEPAPAGHHAESSEGPHAQPQPEHGAPPRAMKLPHTSERG